MSVLKNAIEALDPAPNKKTELTLALQCLFELAEQKTQLFKHELQQNLRTAGTPDNQTIPVTQILAWHNETRAYVQSVLRNAEMYRRLYGPKTIAAKTD